MLLFREKGNEFLDRKLHRNYKMYFSNEMSHSFYQELNEL